METISEIFKTILSAVGWVISSLWGIFVWLVNQAWDLILKPIAAFTIDWYAESFTAHPIANTIVILLVVASYYVVSYFQRRKGKGSRIKPFALITAAAPFVVGVSSAILNLVLPTEPGATININSQNTDYGANNTVVQGSGNTIGSNNSTNANSGNTTSNTSNSNKATRGPTNSVTIKDSTVSGSEVTQNASSSSAAGANPAAQGTLRDKAAPRP